MSLRLRRSGSLCGGILILTMLFMWLFAPAAQAAQEAPMAQVSMSLPAAGFDCGASIVDDTSTKVLKADRSVIQWINKLQYDGIDVRIRAVDSPFGGSLDAYYATLLQSCPEWSLDGKHLKPNMVVVMITLENHDLVTSGNSSKLASVSNDIDGIRGAMKAPYDQGLYVQAIAVALQHLYGDLHPGFNWDYVWWPLGIVIVLGLVIWLMIASGGTSTGSGSGSGYRSTTVIISSSYSPPPPPSSGGYSSGSC